MRLEDVKAGVFVRGLAPEGIAKVVGVEWHGDQAITAVYEDDNGAVKNRVVYRDEEPALKVAEYGAPWSFDGDGELLRLVSEPTFRTPLHLVQELEICHAPSHERDRDIQERNAGAPRLGREDVRRTTRYRRSGR